MYIYEMPYKEKNDLCKLLDTSNCVDELAVIHMQFSPEILDDLRRVSCRGCSPSDHLLKLWSDHNHTVLELFILLSRLKLYSAMRIIQPLVDSKYHRLIKAVPTHISLPEQKILNAPIVSNENNESVQLPNHLLKPKSPQPRTNGLSDTSSDTDSAALIPQIPYDELRKSTNDWDGKAVLGRGGFGTVFRGTWKCTQVAIKRIEKKEDTPESNYQQLLQSNTELKCLNAYRHDNILPLYGYSVGGPQPCLVYQYMSGGSLDHRLHVKDPLLVLQWRTRLNIAIGTARGLQFLHTVRDKPLIHGDIKPGNILLDPNDVPRIGDFGLAKEGPQSDYIKLSRIHGTRPYLPLEFMKHKKFSTKVDTYSFGVVLFEIATSATAYSNSREKKFLRDHVVDFQGDMLELKDARASGGENIFKGLMDVGKVCVKAAASERPEMVTVLKRLEDVQ